MAVHQKYEQAVVVQDIADSMMHGEFNHEEHQALLWQLVVDANVRRIDAGESFVFVNLTGANYAAHKVELDGMFSIGDLVHWVYSSKTFTHLKVIIRPVPDDTLKLVLDLKLVSSTEIYACMRDLNGLPVISTNFPVAVPLTVGRLKTIVKVKLAGHVLQRSVFARLDVYFQNSNVLADGLASGVLLWRPTWQLPLGRFNMQGKRCRKKTAPEHPTMNYWLARDS